MTSTESKLTGINIFPSESVFKAHKNELSDGDLAIVPVDCESLRGKSAYQAAVERGFEGTETEWLETLKGEQGDKGEKGDIGEQGLSAYEVAVKEGFSGSKTDWLLSLRGAPGESGSGLPVGFEYFSINPNLPSGSLPLFGGLFSREVYSSLWEYAKSQPGYVISEEQWQALSSSNNGNVPFYSFGDGETTFRVPSLTCWIKGANGLEEVGSFLEAGLPNIEGSITGSDYSLFSASNITNRGALAASGGNYTSSGTSSASTYKDKLTINASLSNPIYGNSDTVQPLSIVGMWLVKAYGTVFNEGNLEVSAIETRLNQVEELLGSINSKLDNI